MVFVIITSERRFALPKLLFDIYVLDRGTSAPRSSCSFYFNQAPVANKIIKEGIEPRF